MDKHELREIIAFNMVSYYREEVRNSFTTMEEFCTANHAAMFEGDVHLCEVLDALGDDAYIAPAGYLFLYADIFFNS